MNKLTVEVARRHQRDLKSFQENPKIGLSLKEELYLQALEIALPVLEQQEKGGWIEWNGGECPVGKDEMIDIKYGDDAYANYVRAGAFNWKHDDDCYPIIAYRVVEQERERGEEA